MSSSAVIPRLLRHGHNGVVAREPFICGGFERALTVIESGIHVTYALFPMSSKTDVTFSTMKNVE